MMSDRIRKKQVPPASEEMAFHYRLTLDSMGDAIHVVDPDLRIVLFNRAFYRWNEKLGLETDVIGQDLFQIFPFLSKQVQDEYRHIFQTGGVVLTEECTCIGSADLFTETRKIPILEEDRVVQVVTVIRDITERKRAEQSLQRSNERLRTLRQIDQHILAAQSPETIAQAALDRIRQLIPCTRASITEFDTEIQEFVILTAHTDTATALTVDTRFPIPDFRAGPTLQRGKTFTIEDIEALPDPHPIEQGLLDEGVRAYVSLPLRTGDELIGSLNLGLAQPGVLEKEQLDIAHEIADSLAIALQNAHLLEIERRRSAELEALRQSSLHLTSSLNLHSVLQIILQQALYLVTADDAHIFLYDGQTLTFGAALDPDGFKQQPYANPRPQGLTYAVAQSGERIIVPDMKQHPLFQDSPWSGAIAGLPLRIGERVVGVMSLAFHKTHRFSESELHIVRMLADQAAIVIENAHLHERVQRHAIELEQRVRERTADLRLSEEKSRAQYKAIPAPTYSWQKIGPDLVLVDYNDAAVAITQGNIVDFVGRTAGEMYSHVPEVLNDLDRCLSEKTSIELEMLYHFQSTGQYRHLAVKYAFVPPDQVLVHTEDITERKLAEAAIRERTAQLEVVNRELESFGQSVSHDLRTPLFSIQGFTQALLEDYGEQLDETGRHYLDRITSATQRMDSLIQDLLSYSRIGRIELKPEPVSLDGLVHQVLSQLECSIEQTCAQIHIEQPLPSTVGHRSILVQVISNLLSNALKFVEPGAQPQVRLWAETKGDWTRLWVEDNGIGIAPKDWERIFYVFERLHSNETYPGTGIGLAIVQKGVERMGGRVGVESSPGQGSRFWIELPQV